MRCAMIVAVLIGIGVPSVTATEVIRLDMGSEDSPLRPDFIRVTAETVYGSDRGYGWRTADGLRTHVRDYSREWEYNPSRGREQPPPIYTNQITCDTISGSTPNALLIDVPPGDYTVTLFSGLSAGSSREYHWFDAACGTTQATVKIPGPYLFAERVLRGSIDNGPLCIELAPKTDWLISAIVVCPADQKQHVEDAFLSQLRREIVLLPPDVAADWKESLHEDPRPMPEFSAADRARGYAVFARHWSEVIWPETVPRSSELDPGLRIFASRGEYEPVTVTILPFEDLREASLTVSDLQCGEHRIAGEQLDIRWVRYMHVRPNYSTYFAYHLAPDVLESKETGSLTAGVNQRFWMTVRVPEQTAAGVYQGQLTFQAAGCDPASVPLQLRVLPIDLKKNPDHIYGMYYRDPLSSVHESNSPEANVYFQRKADWERADMVAHGMTSHIASISGLTRDEAGNWSMDGTETELRIASDRRFGLADQPLVVSFPVTWWYSKLVDPQGTGSHLRLVRDDVPESFFREVTQMVEAIEREREHYDWPDFLYYPIDEPSTTASSVRFMRGVLQAIKRVPGVRTYVTADPSHEQFEPLWPFVDVWCCQPFVFGHDEIQRLSRERDIQFWCYPNHISGENDHTPVCGARMTWGFGFWRSGFRALVPWIYQASVGDPWNYLDGTSMDFFNRSTVDGEPIPVTLWEAYREGIDDGRYLYTLQQLANRARSQGGRPAELAAAAEQDLQDIWDAIRVQEKYKHDGLWSGPDFDAYRWLLASRILQLQAAVDDEDQ